MKSFGEISSKATDVVKNIRAQPKTEQAREMYVDSGRELEIDDAIVRLEEHAVKAREFLSVSQVLALAINDDDSDDNSTDDSDDKSIVVDGSEHFSGKTSGTISKQVTSENPDPEVIARALVDEAHGYKTTEQIVIESISSTGKITKEVLLKEQTVYEVDND